MGIEFLGLLDGFFAIVGVDASGVGSSEKRGLGGLAEAIGSCWTGDGFDFSSGCFLPRICRQPLALESD